MKISELKILKEETIYKRVLDELKVKGLNKLHIRVEEQIDYLDIILSVIDFLQLNKKSLKKLNEEQYEHIIVIIVDEILESMNINISEDQIEKVLQLLKNTLLIQKLTKYLWSKIKNILKRLSCVCTKSKKNNNIENNVIHLENLNKTTINRL